MRQLHFPRELRGGVMDRIYGLIGRTLKHSYSAGIHSELGLPEYRLIELEPEEISEFLSRVDIGGLNVTIPYKREVMQYCIGISEEALAIGSVNTLVRRDDGLYGYNTDAYGFKAMARRAGISFEDKKTVVLGSGGASLTALAAARMYGAREVTVISRSGENNYCNLQKHADADIIVNATPVGMFPHTEESPVCLADFPKCSGVLDMIYNPHRTRLLMDAEKRGIPHADGLYMLVAQAKAAEELFFDKRIPDSEIDRIFAKMRADSENIVLIGMPGSGKNTVGEELSKITGRELIDIDSLIVKRAGISIESIFAENGEDEFRRLEREETAAAGRLSGRIIVTGGGVVKDERNYPSLHCNGRIYEIERDTSLLARKGRPLSKNADLTAMYAERRPMYEAFRDAAADNSGSPRETAEKIWRDFLENTCDKRA